LAGGFLFPQPFSALYTIIGASIGATFLFLAARTAFGEFLRKRAGPMMKKMEKGFEDNAASYLLFLRFVPIFPFWLVNLAPAIFGVSLFTYVWTTVVGITPGSFVFTQAGAGLGAIFDSGESFSIGLLFNNEMKIAFVALGFFALMPVVIRKIASRKVGER
jgi:uncharacterized membrane protein YdjX (TVP38/TMEM64 family)